MVSPRTRGSSHVWRMQRRFALERRRRVERRLERRVDLSDLCERKEENGRSATLFPVSPSIAHVVRIYVDVLGKEKKLATYRIHGAWTVQRRGARPMCRQRSYIDIAGYIRAQRTRFSSPPGCAVDSCIVWQCAVEWRERFRHCECREEDK